MPGGLSEHEQRQLDQIEQALCTEDPRFAHAVRSADPLVHFKRRLIVAAVGFLIGAGMLVAGLVFHIVPVEAAGLAVMLVCVIWAVISYRHLAGFIRSGARTRNRRGTQSQRTPTSHRPSRSHRPPGSVRRNAMERLEERWRRRQERGYG